MQNFDLHMHTTYCDGKDTAEAMARSAIENGLAFAGISGHAFTPHDQSYCMSRAATQQYIDEINTLKKKYAGSIRLLLGTEFDRYSDVDTAPYDYYIGSVHYVFSEEGRRKRNEILTRHSGGSVRGASADETAASDAELEALVKFSDWCPVDDYPEDLCRFAFRDECPGIAAEEAYVDATPEERREKMLYAAELYFDTVGGIVAATDCDIIGHFDLLTKFNEQWAFGYDGRLVKKSPYGICSDLAAAADTSVIYDTADERYIAAWKRAIDRIFDDCAERYKNGYRNRLEKLGVLEAGDRPVFEINTGAISRGYRTAPYPAADQIAYIKSKGGVLILSSDIHAAGTIQSGFDEYGNLI